MIFSCKAMSEIVDFQDYKKWHHSVFTRFIYSEMFYLLKREESAFTRDLEGI